MKKVLLFICLFTFAIPVFATGITPSVKQYSEDGEFGNLTADSIVGSNIVFSGTMTIPGIDRITTGDSTSLERWLQMYATVREISAEVIGSDEFNNYGEYYAPENSNAGVYYFCDASGAPGQSYKIILPARDINNSSPALLIFYLYENANDYRYFYFATNNAYAGWFPSSQPWGSTTTNSCWEIKWQSPPESTQWYFMGAQQFPL